jgi:uncharacterized protein (TIGR03067 family)
VAERPSMETVLLLVFVAGDKPADATVKEFQSLRGEWRVAAVERDGIKAPPGTPRTVLGAIRVTDEMPKRAAIRCDVYAVTLDPAATPKRLSGAVTGGEIKGEKLFAIYRLEGDKLTLCCDYGGTDFPSKFQTAAGDGRVVYHLERQKR